MVGARLTPQRRYPCIAPLTALVALLVMSPVASAQQVRGVVTDSTGSGVAAGILVELVRGGGTAVARTVTTSLGGFTLDAPSPGRYRVRALRIGFRPTQSDDLDVPPAGLDDVRLALGSAPVTLAAIRVRARSACRRVDAGDEDIAAVWEEARKALALAAVTSAARQHVVSVVTYQRDLDGEVVASQQSRRAETTDARAFRSVALDTLMQDGFVVERGGSLVFHGPDADVLLSDRFLSAHCLHLVPAPGEDADNIAIAFEPASRRDVIDVRGTLTLSRTSGELQRLSFSYVGLPDEAAASGGSLHFHRTADGTWFVRRWALRFPVLDVETDALPTASGTARADRVTVRRMREAGGEVVSVRQEDDETFRASLRRLEGRVVSPDSSRGVARVRVWLAGTEHAAVSDVDGRFVLDSLLPAKYRMLASTPLLDSLGGVSPGGTVDLTAGNISSRTVILGEPESIYRELCRVERDDRKGGLLRVTVRNARTRATVPGATVTLRWGGVERNARILGRQQERVLRTEADGSVAFCGAPRDLTIRVRVTIGDAVSPEQEVIIRPLRPFAAIEIPMMVR